MPTIVPMTIPAIAPPERLPEHVSEVEEAVVDCRETRVMGACFEGISKDSRLESHGSASDTTGRNMFIGRRWTE